MNDFLSLAEPVLGQKQQTQQTHRVWLSLLPRQLSGWCLPVPASPVFKLLWPGNSLIRHNSSGNLWSNLSVPDDLVIRFCPDPLGPRGRGGGQGAAERGADSDISYTASPPPLPRPRPAESTAMSGSVSSDSDSSDIAL